MGRTKRQVEPVYKKFESSKKKKKAKKLEEKRKNDTGK